MEAATKNKRGRPKSIHRLSTEGIFDDKEPRTAMNIGYAGQAVLKLMGQNMRGSFFVTERGNFRRQGIAEQLGRMLEEGFSIEACREMMETCINLYNEGESVKEIERILRVYRMSVKAEEKNALHGTAEI